MRDYGLFAAVMCGLMLATPAEAGLYNTAEPEVELSQDLSKFLGDVATLRGYGPPDGVARTQDSDPRKKYLEEVRKLRSKGRLAPEEQANLGAYLIRLRTTRPQRHGGLEPGVPDYYEAIDILETAYRDNPRNFYILANLGTAHQLVGNMDLAERYLEQAETLAPEKHRTFERYHLRLVRMRTREKLERGKIPLDNLFPARFVSDSGEWQVGQLAETERKKLPGESVQEATKIVQQLLSWLPDDARLYWLLGELANAQGDVRSAYDAMDLAVFSLRLSTEELKQRRVLLDEARKKLPQTPPLDLEEPDPLSIAWWGWLLIGLGAVLVVGLTALQVREFFRRGRASAARTH